MLTCRETVVTAKDSSDTQVELSWDQRKRSRYKAVTCCGRELGWMLQRGQTLRDGDCLLAEDGTRIRVKAALEDVSVVLAEDALLLMRAAYHLGNRHMPLQLGEGWLRYQHDHVLDEMVRGFGLRVERLSQPFQPENGAYGSHGGHHRHEH
ncbi:urease accessory protein [Sinobacterium caligoides]|uniref:Urease accessory protein UreE n=1 Tax=Sinobacterium caligoides TaxID=933926 RepID=A0A3N2DG30_9GAMM|nr:urease accessory protein UreE [Sinobacterium caligoides]ROR98742.1 urease accessory protein [Sinobacterium caligoides]